MDLSAPQHHLHHHFHHQELDSDPQSLDIVVACSKAVHNGQHQTSAAQDKKPRPPDNEPQKCPRCDSANTKFCYYNNYSLTQPRYFCKSCRRYWTKGGTLRNVPVGGGCRKNKRSSSSTTSCSSASSPSSSSSSLLKRAHSQDLMEMAANHTNPLFSALHLPSFNSYAGGLGLGFDALGNSNLTDCDGVMAHSHGGTLMESMRSGGGGGGAFLDRNSNGGLFQNLCYGFGAGNENVIGGGNSNCVSGISEDMALVPYDDLVSNGGGCGGSSAATAAVTVTTMKQESNESRALWGFPWQMNGDHGSLGGAGIESWNGLIGNSAWHGLLNSAALM